jgi:hypothetical protein
MSRLTGTDAYGLMEAYQAVYAPQELTEEQVWEEVETWVNDLIEEGYDLSDYTWEEMYESYFVNEFNTIVDGLIEEGYDLSKYTEQELFDALISERRQFTGALKNVWNSIRKTKIPKQQGIPPAPSSSVPYGNRTLTGTPPRPALPAATKAPAPSKGDPLAATKPNSSSLTVTKPNSSSMTATGIKPVSVKDLGNTWPPAGYRGSALVAPPAGNKNGKRAAGIGLGLLGLGALASMNKGGGGNEAGTSKPKPLASRRKEQLVGGKGNGELTATGSIVSQAKNLNKKGGISLGSGGTGYLAQQGGKLVAVQAKGIGADDGIIGKAARKLGLTKDKDKALEAQRQNASRANREKYLQAQGLTDPNVTGYQAKGAVRKGKETGLNIKDSYEYDTFDTVLEYLIAEGYADSNESALVIMANMSEEWRQSIVNENLGNFVRTAGEVIRNPIGAINSLGRDPNLTKRAPDDPRLVDVSTAAKAARNLPGSRVYKQRQQQMNR